jgi:predicted dehydrogenase
MAKKLNWGILTTGWIARKFAVDLRQAHTGQLVAVGARQLADAQKFAAEFGAPGAYGSYQAVLDDPAVEAVYIGTPHPWHAEWAIKAAQAGKHILCEKPLTLRLSDTQRVIAAAQKHNVLLMEAFMYRFHPQMRKVVELVQSGAIGDVRVIRASFNVVRSFDPAHRMFNKALGGGTILDLGCYPVSYSRHIAGAVQGKDFAEPVKFHGMGDVNPATGTDEFATAIAEYPGGIIAELSCGSTRLDDNAVKIHGTAGWIHVTQPFTGGQLGKPVKIFLHRRGAEPEEIVIHTPDMGLYAYEADAVAAALARGAREVPLASWADSIGTARVLDAWLEAAGVIYG